jgi:MFS family permease
MKALRAVALDVSLLRRRRDLRLLTFGYAVSLAGGQFTIVAALFAAATAVLRPPLDALLPRVVAREELKAATALNWSFSEMAMIGSPALAGVLIGAAGVEWAYVVDVASFCGSLLAFSRLRTPPPPPDAEPPSLRGVIAGVRYAFSRQELIGSYVVDINAVFFGMPFALFPALGEGYGGPPVVGLLFAAPGVGSLIAMLTSGWSRHVHHHGRAIVLGASGWGLAIVGFGLAHELWLALVCLALAGAGDAISGIFRGVLWNETIPDRLRGRLAGMEMISWSSGPTLGSAEAGVAARLVGLRSSVVLGGLLCVAGSVVLAALLPRFWNYDSRAASDA